jgi:hypothetical protein
LDFQLRENLYSENILNLLNFGSEGSFLIIEEPQSRKFIQFLYWGKKETVLMDIPFLILDINQTERLNQLLPDLRKTPISYQLETKPEQAIEIIELVFRYIFQTKSNFDIECEIEP